MSLKREKISLIFKVGFSFQYLQESTAPEMFFMSEGAFPWQCCAG